MTDLFIFDLMTFINELVIITISYDLFCDIDTYIGPNLYVGDPHNFLL